MKATLHLIAWTFAMLALAWAAVGPNGALLHHPLAAVGAGLIGLGLIVEARQRVDRTTSKP